VAAELSKHSDIDYLLAEKVRCAPYYYVYVCMPCIRHATLFYVYVITMKIA
jgi:hypothetical protein